jgi:hypothetical protein
MSRKIIIVTAIVVFLLLRLSAQVPSLPRVTLKLADTTGIVGDTLTLICLADKTNQRLLIQNSNQLSGIYSWEVSDLNDPISGEIGAVSFPCTSLSQAIPLSGWFSTFGIWFFSTDSMAEYYGEITFTDPRIHYTYDGAGNRVRREKH